MGGRGYLLDDPVHGSDRGGYLPHWTRDGETAYFRPYEPNWYTTSNNNIDF